MSAPRGAQAVDIRPGTGEHESALGEELHALIGRFISSEDGKKRMRQACVPFLGALASCPGRTCQEQWNHFEQAIWPRWIAGDTRPPLTHWTAGPRALVLTRRVTPTWDWLADLPVQRWIAVLPTSDPWRHAQDRLQSAVALIAWASRCAQEKAVVVGLRVLITRGYARLEEITDDDLAQIPSGARGQDVLDAALCGLGILPRTPQRGTSRRSRRRRATVAELVAMADIAEPFRALTLLYLETYATRVSHVYVTLRHKLIAQGHFWRFLAEHYPDITRSADVLPAHGRAYMPSRAPASGSAAKTPVRARAVPHMSGCSKSAPSSRTSARGRLSRSRRLRPMHRGSSH